MRVSKSAKSSKWQMDVTPPRLERSFGFIDLCGFTDFSEQHGDEDAARVLHRLRAIVRAAASNHGVLIDKWLGDGAMLVSGELSPLLAAIVEIKLAVAETSPLEMRAGLAAGPVLVFEGDDYVGRAINLASKICDLAEPGQCLAPASLAVETVAGIAAGPIGSRRIPGFAGLVELVSVDVAADEIGAQRRAAGVALGTAARIRPNRWMKVAALFGGHRGTGRSSRRHRRR